MLGLLLLAVAPTLFIFLYIYRKDRVEPEPLHLVVWVFSLGALSVIPAALIELLFSEGVFLSAVVAPLVEETAKFLIVFFAIYRHAEFDEPVDGIVYATAAGLGFATIENILYVLEGGLAVGIVRAVASVPGHVVFSGIWGFALGTAKFRPEKKRMRIILSGLAGAMLLHGLFNFSLAVFEAAGLLLILLVIMPFGWWMTSRNIRCAQADPAAACVVLGRVAAAGGRGVVQGTPMGNGVQQVSAGIPEPVQHFCTACGSPLKAGMRFCGTCGKEV